jgi:hypothetical protein
VIMSLCETNSSKSAGRYFSTKGNSIVMAEIFQGGEIVALIDSGFPRTEVGLEAHLLFSHWRINSLVSHWICHEEHGCRGNLSDYQLPCTHYRCFILM